VAGHQSSNHERTRSGRWGRYRLWVAGTVAVVSSVALLAAPVSGTTAPADVWSAGTASLTGLNPPFVPTPSVTPDNVMNFGGVDCTAVGACVATGDYLSTIGTVPALFDTLANGTWTAQTASVTGLDPTSGAPNVDMTGVSCPESGSCVASGYYSDTNNDYDGLLYTLSNGAWTPQTAPTTGLTPAPETVNTGETPEIDLAGVSCPGTGLVTTCVAAGFYLDNAENDLPMIETLSSGVWTPQTLSVGTLNPPALSNTYYYLRGVSCPAAGTCVAVGQYRDTALVDTGFIATLSNGTWTYQSAPGGLVNAVTCAAVGSCVAVGAELNTLADGTWTAQPIPTTGLSPAVSKTFPPGLGSVSCPDAGDCVATGTYDTSSGDYPLIETLLAGTWRAETGPTKSLSPGINKSDHFISLSAVSCAAAGYCASLGDYLDPSFDFEGIVAASVPEVGVTTTALPGGAVGSPYPTATLQATGGQQPDAWSHTGTLPAGLSLDSSTGVISGTPTKPGTSTLTFKVTDSSTPALTASKSLKIVIAKGSQTITFTTLPPSNPAPGTTYDVGATATSGLAVAFTIDSKSTSGACTVSKTTVTFKKAGSCIVDAKQAGNTDWSAAPELQQDIAVS
jgi:hypothetical protein